MRKLLPWLPSILLFPIALSGTIELLSNDRPQWPHELLIIAPAPEPEPPSLPLASELPDIDDVANPRPFLQALIQMAQQGAFDSQQRKLLMDLIHQGGIAAQERFRLEAGRRKGNYRLLYALHRLLSALTPREFDIFRQAALDPHAPLLEWKELATRARKWVTTGPGTTRRPSNQPRR